MSSRLRAAAFLPLLAVIGCDPDVVVGYAADATAVAQRVPVTWLSGTHSGNEPPDYTAFGAWRDRPVGLAHLYTDRNTWGGLVNPGWPLDVFASFPGQVMLSQPLYPLGMGNNQDCASGAYDAEWRQLGAYLLERDRGDAIIRLGWGPSDPSHEWRSEPDPTQWKECFRRVVTAIRATHPRVRIDWTLDAHTWPDGTLADPYDAYPGDEYVDVIGADAYDMHPPTHDEAEWQRKCNGPNGLCRMIEFAREHGKQVGFGEWGVVSCGEDPGGDNPFFIDKMFETFAANTDILAYEAYFDDTGADVCTTIMHDGPNPESARRYRELYRTTSSD